MPFLFRKSDEGDYWFRFYYPPGADMGAICAARGWSQTIPEGVQVLDEHGAVMQEAADRKKREA